MGVVGIERGDHLGASGISGEGGADNLLRSDADGVRRGRGLLVLGLGCGRAELGSELRTRD
jgi:hypothetical protein